MATEKLRENKKTEEALSGKQKKQKLKDVKNLRDADGSDTDYNGY